MKRLAMLLLFAGCQLEPQACVDWHQIVRVIGCDDKICQVILDDGYITNVPKSEGFIGNKVGL